MEIKQFLSKEIEETVDYICNYCGRSFVEVSGTMYSGSNFVVDFVPHYKQQTYCTLSLCEQCCKEIIEKCTVKPLEFELEDDDNYIPGIDFYM